MNSLEKKIVLVVGSEEGLGCFLAEQFLKAGAKTIFHYRTKKPKMKSSSVVFDVRDSKIVQSEINRVVHDFGGIDILVNCVGPYTPQSIEKITEEEWRENIEAILHGSFFLARAVLPTMRKQKSGKIIFVGDESVGELKTSPIAVPYKIAKNGLVTLTHALAETEKQNEIGIHLVSPGFLPNSIVKPPKGEKEMTFKEVWEKIQNVL